MTTFKDRSFFSTALSTAVAATLLAAAGLAAGKASAQDLSELAAEAAQAGPVIWYESSPAELGAQVVAAFREAYPEIDLRHVRLDANAISARVMQETQARAATADVGIATSDQVWMLSQQGVLQATDAAALGVEANLIPHEEYLITTAPFYVLLWNQNNVAEDEVPNSWEELLDPKWTGRIGTWVRPAAFAQLAQIWGEDEARSYLEKFTELQPILFQSTFPLAQQVGAGEVDIGIGIYHAAQPPIQAGAPLGLKVLDPTPVSTLYSFIPQNGRNPAGAKVFLAWLHSLEGAMAYEEATDRGNHMIPGTRTGDMLAERQAADFPPEESDRVAELTAEFTEILGRAGAAR